MLSELERGLENAWPRRHKSLTSRVDASEISRQSDITCPKLGQADCFCFWFSLSEEICV